MRLSDETIRGKTTIAADGQVVGDVTSILLDCDAWRVESIHVRLRKETADQLGADRSMFHAGSLDIPVRMIQSIGDTVVLSVPIQRLREVLPPAPENTVVAD